jgi:O-methyltransferase/demethyldecarbamoylnovobiocin O-methyltransferase/8-demethyl-8-(2,3-dimethoxy-alpha-L-rhamnosyl)tetracenomycin-C 4'-O-methyltransferase
MLLGTFFCALLLREWITCLALQEFAHPLASVASAEALQSRKQDLINSSETKVLDMYMDLLQNAVSGYIYKEFGAYNRSVKACVMRDEPMDFEGGNVHMTVGHTMVGFTRLRNIRDCIKEAIRDNIPGDFYELGVWRGGACIYARGVLNALGHPHRAVHVFDAFENIRNYGGKSSYLSVSEAQVRSNFEKYGLTNNVVFHKGLFKDTVPQFRSRVTTPIAVLRIDGNFYDSYQDALYAFYDKVPVGGFVIFDDIVSHTAVMRQWRDFKQDHSIPEEPKRLDRHSAFFRKTVDSPIDQSKMRAPQDANK